ncbi:MAG: hypothetical protein M1541_18125, partial [Acidobacteria bacterium]|nr:hypothetical protein [Acidobacteriota bacterium]
MRLILFILAGSLSIAWGQAPDNAVIDPRGVVNAYSRMPAPSRAGRGGLIEISGFNLGPPEGAKAPAAEWPTELGGIQVLINGTAAPVGSADPGKIVAQVPLDAQVGLAEVVVTRGSVSSRPARIFIAAQEPSVRTADDSGYGQPFGTDSGGSLTLAASGLVPDAPVVAYIGGIRANASAAASGTRVGEFDIQVSVPDGARPGDLIQIVAGGRAGNATVFRPMQDAEMQYLPLPDGAPELRRLTDTDLNGNYLIGSGAKDAQGCFPAFLFNFAAKKASPAADCLTAANANAVVASADSDALGALVGPPQGEAPAGISSKVEIFSPSRSEPLSVDLPGAALSLNGGAGGNFTAVLPGTPPQVVAIASETGEVRAGAGNAGGAAGGALGSIDVDGLTHVLSAPVSVGPGRLAVVVGDDAEQPTRAKFAVIGAAGAVAQSRDFPEGWLPLLAPAPPNRPNAAALPRGSVTYDAARRMFFVLSRMPDDSKHGFVAFGLDRAEPRALPFPDGWFAAACTPNIRIFTLDLSRRLVIAGSSVAASEVRTPCTAMGFIQLDLTRLSAPTAVPLPGQAQMSGALGPDSEVNDYIYGTDIDTERDTVYVLDGVTASTFTKTGGPWI